MTILDQTRSKIDSIVKAEVDYTYAQGAKVSGMDLGITIDSVIEQIPALSHDNRQHRNLVRDAVVAYRDKLTQKIDTDQYVFVYGTLKKGYNLHQVLEGSYSFGAGRLYDHFIYHLGSFPGISPEKNAGPVIGEVYEVTLDVMETLDMVEGEGSLYHRRLVPVEIHVGVRRCTVQAWAYIYAGRPLSDQRIESGEWIRSEHLS